MAKFSLTVGWLSSCLYYLVFNFFPTCKLPFASTTTATWHKKFKGQVVPNHKFMAYHDATQPRRRGEQTNTRRWSQGVPGEGTWSFTKLPYQANIHFWLTQTKKSYYIVRDMLELNRKHIYNYIYNLMFDVHPLQMRWTHAGTTKCALCFKSPSCSFHAPLDVELNWKYIVYINGRLPVA